MQLSDKLEYPLFMHFDTTWEPAVLRPAANSWRCSLIQLKIIIRVAYTPSHTRLSNKKCNKLSTKNYILDYTLKWDECK